MQKLTVAIIGKEKLLYEGEADAVFVPTKTGVIEVLPEHMQLISALQKGEVIVKTKESDLVFKITGGVLEVRAKSNVIILADVVKE